MRLSGYLLSLVFIVFLIGCQKTIKPDKKVPQENNATVAQTQSLPNKEQEVREALTRYLQELENYDVDTIVDLTYPQLFNAIDLDIYRQSIVAFINSTQIEEELYETNITKICKPILFSNGREFAQVEYTAINRIRFIDETIYDTEKKMNYLYDVFIHKFGKDNIQFDTENRTITKQEHNKLLMIKDKDEEWKFLGDNHFYRMHYPIILPLEIYKIIQQGDNNETC